jgi:hypothetical protein
MRRLHGTDPTQPAPSHESRPAPSHGEARTLFAVLPPTHGPANQPCPSCREYGQIRRLTLAGQDRGALILYQCAQCEHRWTVKIRAGNEPHWMCAFR